MFQIDAMGRTPVYGQIIEQTERFVATGILKSGDPMPSVRSLSLQLSVNPNTIQKAFNELSSRGIIVSVPGKGSFISERAADILNSKSRARIGEFRDISEQLINAGISPDELTALIRDIAAAKEEVNDSSR